MSDIDLLIYIYIIFVFAIISPGANMVYLIAASVSGGKIAGLLAAIGIALGSLTWSTISVVFVDKLIDYSDLIGLLISTLGGAYLVYMGINQFQLRFSKVDENKSPLKASCWSYMFGGYLVMVSNPKAILAWISIVSFISLKAQSENLNIFVIVGTFTISLVLHSVFSLCFSWVKFKKLYLSNYYFFRLVFSLVFCFLGIYLVIRSAYQTLSLFSI